MPPNVPQIYKLHWLGSHTTESGQSTKTAPAFTQNAKSGWINAISYEFNILGKPRKWIERPDENGQA